MPFSPTIALVTPMRNEIQNIPVLYSTLENQTISIKLWIIINDGSTDGSEEYVSSLNNTCKNIDKIIVHTLPTKSETYTLSRYAQVVERGFAILKEYEKNNNHIFDFIGIVDADSDLDKNYFGSLIQKFNHLPKLGIASGKMYYFENDRKIMHHLPDRFPLGGMRLWRGRCFHECGWVIGESPDALSTAQAWLKGWHCQSFNDVFVKSRKLGEKHDAEFYGMAAYKRFVPLYFALARAFLHCLIGKRKENKGYLKGYFNAMKQKRTQINKALRLYYYFFPVRIIVENIIVAKNNKKIARDLQL
jgi:glycosyltransferase involved in cell wall biosynthesis